MNIACIFFQGKVHRCRVPNGVVGSNESVQEVCLTLILHKEFISHS